MSLSDSTKEFSWKDISQTVTIRECQFARLKYYLNLVAYALKDEEISPIPGKFTTGYGEAWAPNISEGEELLQLARRWHPDLMVERGLFRIDDERQFCVDKEICWIEITVKETKGNARRQTATETTRTLRLLYITSRSLDIYFYVACEAAEKKLRLKRLDEWSPELKAIAKTHIADGDAISHLVAVVSKEKEAK
jgi:hypothetical protein